MPDAINSPAHQTHADGLQAALADRQITLPHHINPAPRMKRTWPGHTEGYAPYPIDPALYTDAPRPDPDACPTCAPQWQALVWILGISMLWMVGVVTMFTYNSACSL